MVEVLEVECGLLNSHYMKMRADDAARNNTQFEGLFNSAVSAGLKAEFFIEGDAISVNCMYYDGTRDYCGAAGGDNICSARSALASVLFR